MDANQLITVKENFLVVLDSRNAVKINNGSMNSDVYFELEEPIRVPKDKIQFYASVLNFSAPNSLYNVNQTNNLLSITLYDIFDSYYNIFDGHLLNYSIPYGNYNANTFMKELSSLLGSSFFITFNSVSNTFTIQNGSYDFDINPSSTIGEVMGFSKNTKYSSTNKILKLPFTCNFSGLNSLNLHLTNFNTQNIDSFNRCVSTIFLAIPINPNSRQIFYDKSNDFNFVINEENIDYINVQIRDDLENFLDFNNQHWNLTLYFTIIKDIDRFSHHNSFFTILQNGYS